MLQLAFTWLVIAWACFAAGCDEAVTGDYKTYAELDETRKGADAQPEARSEVGKRKSETEKRNSANPTYESRPPNSRPEDNGDSATTDSIGPSRPETPVKPGEVVPATGSQQQPPKTTKTAGRKVRLLIKDRKFKVEGPQNAIRVSYDDIDLLKVLNMEPVTPDAPDLMPAWLKQLDGKRIRIRGFMYPPPLETGIEAFALARDNQICCFGKNPKIYDVFPVFLQKGVTTDYILNRPFDVVGVFHVNPAVEDGKLQRLYEMDDAIVIDKQR